jgi:FkbM family methyltransferase
MGLAKSVKKRIDWAKNVKFDNRTGFFRYLKYGRNLYIRHPRHFVRDDVTDWVCEKIFFHYYLPRNNDVVVDLGAGYGDEALYLAQRSPRVRYIGVEPQPVIYECLANTFAELGDNFIASPYVITDRPSVRFVSQFSYASVGEIPQGYIEVPTMGWADFLQHYGIEKIDLFKMNIEGAEREMMKLITDFSLISRFVISCHDFRADNEGEYYRTKATVVSTLTDNGYRVKTFSCGVNWADDYIYAER